jgi:hypothetical protein
VHELEIRMLLAFLLAVGAVALIPSWGTAFVAVVEMRLSGTSLVVYSGSHSETIGVLGIEVIVYG